MLSDPVHYVLLAACGVFGTGAGWPDFAVATIMAVLALQGAYVVIGHALGELRTNRTPIRPLRVGQQNRS